VSAGIPLRYEIRLIESLNRFRMKLEPQDDKPVHSRVEALDEPVRDVNPPDPDTLSVHQAEVPPWADGYEISSTDMEGLVSHPS